MSCSTTLVNVNGQGLITSNNIVTSPLSGHEPLTVAELFHRAEKARNLAKQYIETAANMERLAMEAMTEVII